MLSSKQNSVRRILNCPLLAVPCFLLLLLLAAPGASAQTAPSAATSTTLEYAVHQLADRVSSIPNFRGAVRIQFYEDAALTSETGQDWQDVFRKELEETRFTITEDAAANVLRVGLTETPTALVLSAGVRINEKEEARFAMLPRTTFRAANLPVVSVRIEKEQVFQSGERILDAGALTGSETGLLLLAYRGTELSVMRVDGSGVITQIVSLASAGVRTSRDSRGEVSAASYEANVILPGKRCQIGWAAAGDVKCRATKVAWRASVVLKASCDAEGWKLVADGADWSSPDLLQVVPESALRKRSAVLLSDFPGPILSISAGQSASSALVVTRNLRTGNYEVYKVTLACGN